MYFQFTCKEQYGESLLDLGEITPFLNLTDEVNWANFWLSDESLMRNVADIKSFLARE